jgi:hypothetical protein
MGYSAKNSNKTTAQVASDEEIFEVRLTAFD